jgi:hypothetical protein
MNDIARCPFCTQVVLGLRGQDLFLDSFFLQDSDADRRATAAGVLGHCHARCLAESEWAQFWAERVRENFEEVRRFELIVDDEAFTVFRNQALQEHILLRPDGWFVRVYHRELNDAYSRSAGVLIPVSETRSDLAKLTSEVDLSPDNQSRRSLADLVSAMGVESFLYDRRGLDRASFHFNERHDLSVSYGIWLESGLYEALTRGSDTRGGEW